MKTTHVKPTSNRHSLLLALLMAFSSAIFTHTAFAVLDQQVAVGVCQAVNGGPEAEFTGASYIISSNMDPGVEYICPINGFTAPPEKINSATVFLLNSSNIDLASVQLCFTNLSGTGQPTETCGETAYSSNAYGSAEAIKVGPPTMIKGDPLNAFLKVWMPAPFPMGYAYLRGFQVN